MRNALCGLLGVVLLLAVLAVEYVPAAGPLSAADKKADERLKTNLWMTKKLEFSQKILAGLTKGDFDLIEQNAGEMYAVGYLEKWDMADLPDYRRHVKTFDMLNKDLMRHAKDKDVKAATQTYTKLIASCVECHQVVRSAKKK